MVRQKRKEEPSGPFRRCDHAGCAAHADYRAPKTREARPDYHWFCLDHVRDYNKSWNYFDGMEADEIEAFMHEAVTGHRPTWYMSGNGAYSPERLQAAFDAFMMDDSQWRAQQVPPAEPRHRKALRELELDHPADRPSIKQQYKRLAKQFHPDINPGDKSAEERFKHITQAYRTLMSEYIQPERAKA